MTPDPEKRVKSKTLKSSKPLDLWGSTLSEEGESLKEEGAAIASWTERFLEYLIPIDVVYFLALILFLGLLPFSGLDQRLGGGSALSRYLSLPEDKQVESYLFYLGSEDPSSVLAGQAQSRDETATPSFVLKDKTYTIQAGDTLSLVSVRNNVTVETLIAYNGISDVKRLRAGDKIKVPNMNGILYQVKAGDSISSLASTYKVTRESILDANDLSNSVLSIGQKIFLPGARMNQTKLQEALGELFIYPVRGIITSRYGWRIDPISGIRAFHNGVDFANRLNTPIYASRAGRVILASVHPEFGKYIIIEHGSGYQTLYGHLNSFEVVKGQYVNRGQLIARMGNTGYSTGTHLHFSIYKNGKSVNPLSLLG